LLLARFYDCSWIYCCIIRAVIVGVQFCQSLINMEKLNTCHEDILGRHIFL